MPTNSHVLSEISNDIATITLNRPQKYNAFNAEMLKELTHVLNTIKQNEAVKALVFKASGNNFCAGADLEWMRDSLQLSEDENYADALLLADFFHHLYYLSKPTIAVVQGKTFGGGLGIISCCDLVIAEKNASFAFSEVKLGLAPATIAPYVIQAIGLRQAKRLFMTAEIFSSQQAFNLGLVHYRVESGELDLTTQQIVGQIVKNSTAAISACKQFINSISPIDETISKQSAELIARLRSSKEAKSRIEAFLSMKDIQYETKKKN